MSGASSATVQLHESVAAAIPLWAVRVLSPYRRGQTVEQISRDIRVSRYQMVGDLAGQEPRGRWRRILDVLR